jgi:hypothetical protein
MRRVSNPQLVKQVGVREREIKDRAIAQHQAFEHRLVNDAAHQLFVRAERSHVGHFDGRHDYAIPYVLEVDDPSASRLGSERKRNEAKRLWHDRLPNMPPRQVGTHLYLVL